ncbi:hypothetical protein [Shinella sp. M31]|jgi:hypothetical protein|uniref:hypothetical protein n=1 Tax=Shinella sp. M31 TaxID=3368615 RepID=UPI003BA14073
MANIAVLGLQGEEGLWVVDFSAGTVTALPAPSTGALKDADDLRKAGATVTKGVNLAVLATSADAASGGYMDAGGGYMDADGGYMDK